VRYARPKRLIVGFAAAVAIVGAAVTGLDLALRYRESIQAASRTASELSFILAEHAAATLEAVDRATVAAAEAHARWRDLPEPTAEAGYRLLEPIRRGLPALAGIAWMNAKGDLIAWARSPRPPAANVAEQPHFVAQRERDDVGLYIGTQFTSAIDRQEVSVVSRRLEGSGRVFAGIVAALVDFDYFERLYENASFELSPAVSLRRTDGALLAGVQQRGGERDIVATSGVRGFPVEVTVAVRRSDALSPWQRRVGISIALLLAYGGVIGYGAALLVRAIRRLDANRNALHASEVRARESAERLAKAFAVSPAMLSITRLADGRFLDVNDNCATITGYRRDELIGKTTLELNLWADPEQRRDLQALIAEGASPRDFKMQFRTRNGDIREALMAVERIEIDGEPCLIISAHDITDRKRAEQALRDSERALATAQRLARVGSWERTPAGDRQTWSPETYRIMGWPVDQMPPSAPELYDKCIHPDDRGILREAMANAVANRKPTECEFRIVRPDGEVRVVRLVGEPVTGADGIRSVAGAVQDITELRAVEIALRESERRARTSADALPVLVGQIDAEWRYVFVNRLYEEWVKRPRDRIVGHTVEEVVGPEAFARMRPYIARAFAGEEVTYDTAVTLPDGKHRSLRVRYQPDVAADGKVTRIFSMVEDVTERERMTGALRESEANYRRLVEVSPDAIVVHRDRRILFANGAACALFGAGGERELLGRSILDLMAPEDRVSGDRRAAEIQAGGLSVPIAEGQLQRLDGTLIPVERGEAYTIFNGGPAVQSIFRDITERKRALAALRESRASLVNAQRIANLGNWDWDIASNGLKWSDQIYRIFGLEPQEFGATYPAFLERVHPDDRDKVIEAVRQAVEARKPYAIDHRIILPDRSVRIVHEEGEVSFDEGGRPLRMTGTVQDVTETRYAEEALREANRRLRLVTDNLPVIVTYVDNELRYRFANRTAAAWYRRDQNDFIGRRVQEVLLPESFAKVEAKMAEALAGRTVRYERTMSYQDGTTREVEVQYFPDVTPAGDVDGFFTMVADITERKRHEAALHNSERRFRATFEQAAVGVALVAPDGRWLTVNDRLCRIVGYSAEELMRSDFQSITHPDDLAADLGFVGKMLTGEIASYAMEKRYIRKDGSIVWINLTVGLVRDDGGKPDYFVSVVEDIGERKKAEEALRASQELFSRVFRMSPDVLTITSADSGRYMAVSDSFERQHGYRPDEVIGRTSSDIGIWAEPGFRDRMLAELRAGRPVRDVETRMRHRSGDIRDAQVNADLMTWRGETCLLVNARDITERKRAAENLRTSEARLAGIIEITPAAIIVADQDRRIRLFNSGAEQIFGYAAAEAIGQPVEILMPERFRREHGAHVRGFGQAPEASRTMASRGELVGRRKDGGEFPAAASISKLSVGNEMFFTVLLHDITERKRQERALVTAKEEAELANRAKTEFLANMSHELRTPLNAIIGFSEVISGEMFGPIGVERYREYAADICSSGQHLLNIINDILDVARVEVGKVELNEGAVSPTRLVESCMRLVGERARRNGIALGSEIPAELPRLYVDERKLKQVLINLLANAVKFTPRDGSVSVIAEPTADGGLAIRVRDTGIGMKPEDIPKALAPFGQVDGSLARRFEGAGLGLPLAKALTELHGGRLELDSAPGVGTTATVHLPANRVMRPVPAPAISGSGVSRP
jgi:PAS domain S-box-containing protein